MEGSESNGGGKQNIHIHTTEHSPSPHDKVKMSFLTKESNSVLLRRFSRSNNLGFNAIRANSNTISNTLGLAEKTTFDYWPGVNVPRFIISTATVTIMESFITYPFELIKTRLQVDKTKQGFISAFFDKTKTVYVEYGLRKGLYRGVFTQVMTNFPIQALYYSIYNSTLHQLEKNYDKYFYNNNVDGEADGVYNGRILLPAFAGGFAELMSMVFWVPQDVVIQRLQVGDCSKGGARHVFRKLYAEGGMRSFYRGFAASFCTYLPAGMIWWATFEASKKNLKANTNLSESFTHMIAGASAGVFSSTVTNPMDICKTRLQTGRGCYNSYSFVHVLQTVVKNEGLHALNKGLFGRILITVPGSMISGFFYEKIMSFSKTSIANNDDEKEW